MTQSKQDALSEILRLAREHDISASDIAHSLSPEALSPIQRFAKLFGTFGGIFLLAGITTFMAAYWDMLPPALHILTTLGGGIALFIAGILSLQHDAYRRFATPLLLIAAVLQPFGWLVMLREWFGVLHPQEGAVTAICAILTLQHGLVLLSKRHKDLSNLTLLFAIGTFMGLCEMIGIPFRWQSVVLGASLLCLSYSATKIPALDLHRYTDVAGSILLQIGYFQLVESTLLELSYLLVAGGIIALGLYTHGRMLLFSGALGIFGYIGHFTYEYFRDSLGWPIMLIILGIAFFGIGTLAIRWSKKLSTGTRL